MYFLCLIKQYYYETRPALVLLALMYNSLLFYLLFYIPWLQSHSPIHVARAWI